MSAAREIGIALPALRLAARAWGDPGLPPLFALHGWLDNAASFDRIAPLLTHRYHVVALDLPGHGRSDHRPPGTWYHYVDYLSDVLAAADALGWARFSVLGHSLGGAVGSVLAASRPERIERLLLIEALGPLAGAVDGSLELLRRALTQREQFASKDLRVFPTIDDAARARALAGGLADETARLLVERGTRAVAGGFVWSSDPRLTLASPQRYGEAQILTLLAGIAAPTRLVLAEPAPSFLEPETIRARIDQVRDIRVTRLPGHHHVHMEDPRPVAAALLADG